MQEINMLIFISLNICGNFCDFLTLKRAHARAKAKARAQKNSKSASAANFDERTQSSAGPTGLTISSGTL